jgi:hypothetical protein
MHRSSKQVLIVAGVMVIVFLVWGSCVMRGIRRADTTPSVKVVS